MEKLQNRRKFIKTTGLILVSAILPSVGCDSNKVTFSQMPTGPADVPDDMPDEMLPPAPITSNSRFYLQSIKGQAYDPKLKSEEWSLDVVGLVDNPIQGMTYADITALPLERQAVTLQCIGNWIGGPLIGHAEWGGAPLSTLLERAGVQAEATRVKFDSIDGYSTAISMDIALRPETFLVWKMNGHRLPSRHGYPLRLVNPGHYGQKMPKWITRIELIDEDFLGYWESKPEGKPYKWSNEAIATVNSRIDAPLSLWDDISDPANGSVNIEDQLQTIRGAGGDSFTIHGIALAGERIVERVEVSTDGGSTWNEARIATLMEPNVWVQFAYEWQLPPSGRYEIVARATDSEGDTQPATDQGVDLYDGRTGWHRVPVDVKRTDNPPG